MQILPHATSSRPAILLNRVDLPAPGVVEYTNKTNKHAKYVSNVGRGATRKGAFPKCSSVWIHPMSLKI